MSRVIALALLAPLLSVSRAASLPVEPDYPCYMRNASGNIIDLTQSLCRASKKVTQAATGSITPSTNEKPTQAPPDATAPSDDIESNSDEASE